MSTRDHESKGKEEKQTAGKSNRGGVEEKEQWVRCVVCVDVELSGGSPVNNNLVNNISALFFHKYERKGEGERERERDESQGEI